MPRRNKHSRLKCECSGSCVVIPNNPSSIIRWKDHKCIHQGEDCHLAISRSHGLLPPTRVMSLRTVLLSERILPESAHWVILLRPEHRRHRSMPGGKAGRMAGDRAWGGAHVYHLDLVMGSQVCTGVRTVRLYTLTTCNLAYVTSVELFWNKGIQKLFKEKKQFNHWFEKLITKRVGTVSPVLSVLSPGLPSGISISKDFSK